MFLDVGVGAAPNNLAGKAAVHPAPCTLHTMRICICCTMHTAPCTLHPAPCTRFAYVYAAPCTLHPPLVDAEKQEVRYLRHFWKLGSRKCDTFANSGRTISEFAGR